MAFFKNPEEMFQSRAEKYQKTGAQHYAKAKNQEGDSHYGAAKRIYTNAEIEKEKARKAKGKTW